jgi:hypothetical protein
MKKKHIILIAVVVTAVIAFYVYNEYNRTPASAADRSAIRLSADQLINEFRNDDSVAHKKFDQQVIEISGTPSSVEQESATILVFSNSGYSIRCSMEKPIKASPGAINVRGFYTGFNKDELLGTDILLNRCVIK